MLAEVLGQGSVSQGLVTVHRLSPHVCNHARLAYLLAGRRTDTKLYRLQNPQSPIARTSRYEQYKMDEYPSGTNCVVAVLAYTGGLGHG